MKRESTFLPFPNSCWFVGAGFPNWEGRLPIKRVKRLGMVRIKDRPRANGHRQSLPRWRKLSPSIHWRLMNSTLSLSGSVASSSRSVPRATRIALARQPGVLLRLLLAITVTATCAAGLAAAPRKNQPRPWPPGVRVLRDLEYVSNGHKLKRLDLYLPEKAARPLPVIVWVHGGGWTRGDKSRVPIAWFATNGYAIAAINYRFSQDAIFPAQIQDCKAAVRWLRANALKYGLDAAHVGAWGMSSGGHLVALMGTTAGVKEFEGPGGNEDQSSRVQAVVDWAGPTDFLTAGKKDTRTNLIGGDPDENKEKAIRASPMTYVSRNAAPFLIMHGDRDRTVPFAQSETFARALKKAGAEVTFIVVKGAGHGGPRFTSPENLKQIEEFFRQHLRPGTAGGQ
jgi:acetyl esterase/lipase